MYLTLPIPERNSRGERGGAVYIEECIEKFVEIEYLDGQDGWYSLFLSAVELMIRNCPKCKCKRRAQKQLTISRLPEILIIHFKRFYYQGPFRNKIDTYVEFPINCMDMSRYLPLWQNQKSGQYLYNLFAVSVSPFISYFCLIIRIITAV